MIPSATSPSWWPRSAVWGTTTTRPDPIVAGIMRSIDPLTLAGLLYCGAGLGIAITGACLAWGLDNNLTRKVSLALGYIGGAGTPTAGPMQGAGIVGFIGYGVSLALFVFALRDLGTTRTGAYFSTAPFLGANVSVVAFNELLSGQFALVGGLMAAGVWLHLTENHEHDHEHEPSEHSQGHVHDAHHQYAHGPSDPVGDPHTHSHRHERLRDRHAHTPDMHHSHRH